MIDKHLSNQFDGLFNHVQPLWVCDMAHLLPRSNCRGVVHEHCEEGAEHIHRGSHTEDPIGHGTLRQLLSCKPGSCPAQKEVPNPANVFSTNVWQKHALDSRTSLFSQVGCIGDDYDDLARSDWSEDQQKSSAVKWHGNARPLQGRRQTTGSCHSHWEAVGTAVKALLQRKSGSPKR